MYATQQLAAYSNVQKATMSGREIEAAVLTKAALKLTSIQNNWNDQDRYAKLCEALRYNQLIWSIFQGELVKAENPLPKQLKQDILSLSVFIDKRTFEVLSYPAPEKLNVIININLNIAAGLKGEA
jgi:flagellar biosynthesis activator protein FlaF